jgi:hypothetical protein
MKIALGTVEVTDRQREAIAFYYGDEGLASRDRCRGFIFRNGYEAIYDQEASLCEYEEAERAS